MTMDEFKINILKKEDIVTINARELQNLLIKYDTLKRSLNKANELNNTLVDSNKHLRENLEECRQTHITLDLKI